MGNSSSDMAGGDGISIHSGFPNPAMDKKEQGQSLALDLNHLLVKRPNSTYIFRISGHKWSDQGIYDNDIVVIDRSPNRRPIDIVLVWENDVFKLARQRALELNQETWGVVTAVIHEFK